ncbi:predicted protein [Chaetoceros tenuissimus]|uniref:Uncharacterized protein n=1 Tax=Chaetoceros tenuissimus TaxID=426638 RepID=A0AAD3CYG9_9STRA|nr:predicted protein [Chaetoceros tenuissimus]
MEDHKLVYQEMENLLAISLRHHEQYQRWWYHLPYIKGSDDCLSDYLGIDVDVYHNIMVALGFMTKSERAKHGYQVNTMKFKDFLIQQDLDVESEAVRVDAITKRQILWIGLGKYNSEERYKASCQWNMAQEQYEERSNLALGQLKRKERGPIHTIGRKTNKDLLAYSRISSNWKGKLRFMYTLYQKQNGQENLGSIIDEEIR